MSNTPLPQRRPWPMIWVAAVILVFVGGYTWVRLHYSKPTPAYRPYQDSVNQATVDRLLASGFQRVTLNVERPADLSRALVLREGQSGVLVQPAPGGLSKEIDFALIEKPVLAESYGEVTAPASVAAGQDLRFMATAVQPDNQKLISSVMLLRQGNTITLLPTYEPLRGKLETRGQNTTFLATIPGSTLQPGTYEVLLAGSKTSRLWRFTVREPAAAGK